MTRAERALEQVAQIHGVSVEAVQKEIEILIDNAIRNGNDSTQFFWKQIASMGERPTPAELVQYIAELI